MTDTTNAEADGYYGEDAPNEDFDLSFLDDDDADKKA